MSPKGLLKVKRAFTKERDGVQRYKALRDRTAGLLADVETELRHTDTADDQIGKHARDADAKIQTELTKRRKRLGPSGNDPDAEAAYLWLLAHQRRARLVDALSADAKRRR